MLFPLHLFDRVLPRDGELGHGQQRAQRAGDHEAKRVHGDWKRSSRRPVASERRAKRCALVDQALAFAAA
jgi:hypothetical protein